MRPDRCVEGQQVGSFTEATHELDVSVMQSMTIRTQHEHERMVARRMAACGAQAANRHFVHFRHFRITTSRCEAGESVGSAVRRLP